MECDSCGHPVQDPQQDQQLMQYDRTYSQAMSHLTVGNWEQTIGLLRPLMSQYPTEKRLYLAVLRAATQDFMDIDMENAVNRATASEAWDKLIRLNGVTGEMLSAATVADNLLMALYFFVLVMIPGIGFFRKHYKHPHQDAVESGTADNDAEGTAAAAYWGRKEMSLKDIALAVAVAFVIVAVSGIVADFLAGVIPTSNPVLSMLNTLFGNMYLWIATISMICATAAPGFFGEIRGTNEMGTFLIYLFFFVIGVPASIPLIVRNSPLLLVFAAIVVIVNMLFSLVLGKIFKFDLEEILCASNANIGGPTTSAAMAVSKGWTKLVGPCLIVGTIGYVIGTYCGLIIGSLLGAA